MSSQPCGCDPEELWTCSAFPNCCFGRWQAQDEVRATLQASPRIQELKPEQPMPTKNAGPCIQDLVIADIEGRKVVGLQRYGTLLQPFNGRDALRDAYEEALDLAQYLRQAIEERDASLAALGNAGPGRV